MSRFLVSYDIAGRPARAKVAARLEKAGRRIQKSVYMITCSPEKCHALVQELLLLIEESDSLLCVPLCEACFSQGLLSGPKVPISAFF